jgi:ssDNA-binding replication factor A large subunit
MIEQRRQEAKGLLNYEGAAFLVASDLGVPILQESLKTGVKIKDVLPNLGDVTVTGRVLMVYPTQSFTRPDGSEGKFSRFLIADKTGTLDVVLWDNKSDEVQKKKIEQNNIVKIVHGYSRESLNGKTELHLGLRGEIIVSPKDAVGLDYPLVKDFFIKINELKKDQKEINVIGIVTRIFPVKIFKKGDREGKLVKLSLKDETGEINVVAWNEKVEDLVNVKPGEIVQFMRCRVRENNFGRLEIHVEKRSQINVCTEKVIKIKNENITKIHELKPGINNLNLLAKVVYKSGLNEIEKPDGTSDKSASILLKDESGVLELALNGSNAELASKIGIGDIIYIQGAYTKKGGTNPVLNLHESTIVAINPIIIEEEIFPTISNETIKISEIKPGDTGFIVEGDISDNPALREVALKDGTIVKLASFRIRDETGETRVFAWREQAERVAQFAAGTKIRLRNVGAKAGLGGAVELSTRSDTIIEIV